MKSKDDTSDSSVPAYGSSRKESSDVDGTSISSFMQQEKLCKELYLSMGVPPSNFGDTSDDDVASILEQMSRLQPASGQEPGGGGDRNIEDILREAESLLDEEHLNTKFKSTSRSSRRPFVTSSACTNDDLRDDSHSSDAVHDSQKRLLNVTQTIQATATELESDIEQSDAKSFSNEPQKSARETKQYDAFLASHLVGTPLEVTYKRIYEQIRKEVDGTLKPHLTGDFPDLRLSLPIPGLDTPSFDIPGCFNLEQEFLEERKRCLKLKADLDWLRRQHEREVSELRKHHEGQLNQVREELRPSIHQDSSLLVLQNEVKAQQQIISSYQQENEEINAELKDIKRVLLKLMTLLKTDNDRVCIFP